MGSDPRVLNGPDEDQMRGLWVPAVFPSPAGSGWGEAGAPVVAPVLLRHFTSPPVSSQTPRQVGSLLSSDQTMMLKHFDDLKDTLILLIILTMASVLEHYKKSKSLKNLWYFWSAGALFQFVLLKSQLYWSPWFLSYNVTIQTFPPIFLLCHFRLSCHFPDFTDFNFLPEFCPKTLKFQLIIVNRTLYIMMFCSYMSRKAAF